MAYLFCKLTKFFLTLSGVIFLLIFFLYIILPLTFDRFEYSESYADLNAAVEEGAVRRGWIPSFVSEDAYNIIEMHNHSPSEQFLKFKYISAQSFQSKINKFPEKEGYWRGKKFKKIPYSRLIFRNGFQNMLQDIDHETAECYRMTEGDILLNVYLINDKRNKTAYFLW
ncbi:MAG: hypothetical protein GW748_00195 [Alphaproteobacteria bacterium]|nr:hypothetical protein [Alphaproteobacteria bacterium]NCQ66152.1 hypothetical protein [Alphaproteobacteria bacterium]NCT06500.1 hypothetical protein [Alphaproteobacteria bacterium]